MVLVEMNCLYMWYVIVILLQLTKLITDSVSWLIFIHSVQNWVYYFKRRPRWYTAHKLKQTIFFSLNFQSLKIKHFWATFQLFNIQDFCKDFQFIDKILCSCMGKSMNQQTSNATNLVLGTPSVFGSLNMRAGIWGFYRTYSVTYVKNTAANTKQRFLMFKVSGSERE